MMFNLILIFSFLALSFGYNRLDMAFGEQAQLLFDKKNINYFVHFEDFNHEIMKAGVCFYSFRDNDLITSLRFNNTNYKINSHKQKRIPFVHNQKGMNITLNLNPQQLNQYNDDQVIEKLQIQICGIYTDGEYFEEMNNFNENKSGVQENRLIQNIPYLTEINQNQLNSIYFYQNSLDEVQYVSLQRFYVNNLQANEFYSLSFNLIHLKGEGKMYPKFQVLYNIVNTEIDGEDPNEWNYSGFADLQDAQINYLLNEQNSNTQFLFTIGVDNNYGKKFGIAISIFYNFDSELGKLYQPYVLSQIQPISILENYDQDGEYNQNQNYQGFWDVSEYVNDGENTDQNEVSGKFLDYKMFEYFYFKVQSSYLKISSISESIQPSLQLCQFVNQQNLQHFICSQNFGSIEKELENTEQEFYLIVSPSAKSGISSLIFKQMNFGIQIYTDVISYNNNDVYQLNVGNNNTFVIQNYDKGQPFLALNINFMGIQTSVPQTKIFQNGYTKNMDQFIYSCSKNSKYQCFKNFKENALIGSTTFTDLSVIANLYTQTIIVPSDCQYFVVQQIIYILPKSTGSNMSFINDENLKKEQQKIRNQRKVVSYGINGLLKSDFNQNENYEYMQYIGQVSETVKASLQKTESGKPDHTLELILTMSGLFLIILGFVLYCIITSKLQKKKREKQIQNSSYRHNQNLGTQKQPLLKKQDQNNINNLTELDQNGNSVVTTRN